MKNHPKRRFAELITRGGRVLDVGCWNYSFARYCTAIGVDRLQHYGIDREEIDVSDRPEGYSFVRGDVGTSPFPFPAEFFEAVVASHVIEHIRDPMPVLDEIFRVLKRDGVLYIECPSDRSLWLPSMPFKFEEFRSLNFYDDPTHLGRPQTPQSLYRLFRMYQAEVVETRYLTSTRVRWLLPKHLLSAWFRRDAAALEFAIWWGLGFAVAGIARKTVDGPRTYVL